MSKARILVVEDESIVAMDIRRMLKKIGYDVPAIVSTGEKAIEKAKQTSPNLVMMDIMLKGEMDGIQAATQIRNRFHIPVIYLTAYADESTLQRAKITEPHGYLLKPFQEIELKTTIEMALYKHEMEKKLKENEQWLFTTLKSIGDAVIATDQNCQIKFMNPVAQKLTGWSQEEAIGKPLKDVFDIANEETGEPVEDPAAKVVRDKKTVGLANHTILLSKDGRNIPIDDSAAPITDEKGDLLGVVLVFRDITERRKAEEEIQKIQKLEAVGNLAGSIAHDFNNFLLSIIGNISTAKISNDPKDITQKLLDSEKALIHAKSLTNQLMTFSDGGEPIKKIMNIGKILREFTAFALTKSKAEQEFSIPDELWAVNIDEGQIARVLSNLAINADQAMPDGGTIKVSAENITLDANDKPSLKPGNYVKISVRDQGHGIPKEYIDRIFEPYFTTKQKGNGLGLASSYYILQKHNGYIEVESEIGVGSTFHLYLPAFPETKIKKKSIKNEIIYGEGKILVMDDNSEVRKTLTGMISRLGYEIETASDGSEAIQMYKEAKNSDKPYDLVIMDLTVPGGMGGARAIKVIKDYDPEVKAIVSSGYSSDPIMANYLEYGFSSVIAKPFELSELGRVIQDVLQDDQKNTVSHVL
ncbi:response regulator [Candidatus Poribacteria bacterium]|nr:response regulator [Candidatus Poribacteria bacterium]